MPRPKKYPCIIPSCGKQLKTEWGAKVHYARTHKKELGPWSPDWDGILSNREQLSTMPESAPGNVSPPPVVFLNGMIGALRQAPSTQLSTKNMMSALRERGIDSASDDALRQRIADAIRTHPEVIERISRGLYGLAKKGRRMANQLAFTPPSPPVVIPSVEEIEDDLIETFDSKQAEMLIQNLRRLHQKNQFAILGLTRIVNDLVAD